MRRIDGNEPIVSLRKNEGVQAPSETQGQRIASPTWIIGPVEDHAPDRKSAIESAGSETAKPRSEGRTQVLAGQGLPLERGSYDVFTIHAGLVKCGILQR